MSSQSPQDNARPDPEELLTRYELRDVPPDAGSDRDALGGDSHQRRRGKLRIYLGMAAGVGKTYAMLNEGRRRKSRGADVVIGYVDTHGRQLTAEQIGDLEIVPRMRITYRGRDFEEMDTEAVVKRRPQVALVDELAHTNVPGAPRAKRYEDVKRLLEAGITVITTLNIQHVQGLNDVIEAITGTTQRETVPDALLDAADDVELVDIAPEALRARMRHGHIYPPEQASWALQNYFTDSNLAALRELALKRVAQKTDKQLEAYLQGTTGAETKRTAVGERVMVAFDERPGMAQLLRHGWRLARGLDAPLLAVTITRPSDQEGTRSDPRIEQVARNMRLAEDLGAEVIRVPAGDVAETLAHIAREWHVTAIVLGQPAQRGWRARLRASVVDRLLRLTTGAAIHIVPPKQPLV